MLENVLMILTIDTAQVFWITSIIWSAHLLHPQAHKAIWETVREKRCVWSWSWPVGASHWHKSEVLRAVVTSVRLMGKTKPSCNKRKLWETKSRILKSPVNAETLIPLDVNQSMSIKYKKENVMKELSSERYCLNACFMGAGHLENGQDSTGLCSRASILFRTVKFSSGINLGRFWVTPCYFTVSLFLLFYQWSKETFSCCTCSQAL